MSSTTAPSSTPTSSGSARKGKEGLTPPASVATVVGQEVLTARGGEAIETGKDALTGDAKFQADEARLRAALDALGDGWPETWVIRYATDVLKAALEELEELRVRPSSREGLLATVRRKGERLQATEGNAWKERSRFKDTILEAREAGATLPEIADAAGLTKQRVFQIVKGD